MVIKIILFIYLKLQIVYNPKIILFKNCYFAVIIVDTNYNKS